MIFHDVAQGSPEWMALRLGKVTGSCLEDVFKATHLGLIDRLIAEQLTEMPSDDGFVSYDMQRGIDTEPLALDRYKEIAGVELIRGGFCECTMFPLLGYSPDGRVREIGGVEVKCPKSKTHIQYLRQNQLPNDYKWQVLAAFIINPNLEWNDFMSFDPRVTQKPVFIHRTYRKDVLPVLNQAVEDLKKFFEKLEKYKGEVLFRDEFKMIAA